MTTKATETESRAARVARGRLAEIEALLPQILEAAKAKVAYAERTGVWVGEVGDAKIRLVEVLDMLAGTAP